MPELGAVTHVNRHVGLRFTTCWGRDLLASGHIDVAAPGAGRGFEFAARCGRGRSARANPGGIPVLVVADVTDAAPQGAAPGDSLLSASNRVPGPPRGTAWPTGSRRNQRIASDVTRQQREAGRSRCTLRRHLVRYSGSIESPSNSKFSSCQLGTTSHSRN